MNILLLNVSRLPLKGSVTLTTVDKRLSRNNANGVSGGENI
jgi:hypothetical protein